jgi:hypothetical protein
MAGVTGRPYGRPMASTTIPASTRHLVRWTGVATIVGALAQIAGGILESVDRLPPGEPGFALRTSVMGIAYLLLMTAVIGVGRTGAAGGGWPARVGLVVAGSGWALSAVAQFVLPVDLDLAEKILFPVATVLIAVGMLMVGVGVLRTRQWTGWHRGTPLICGLYPFLAIFPVFAATGGPNFLVLSGWGACWFILGVTLWQD